MTMKLIFVALFVHLSNVHGTERFAPAPTERTPLAALEKWKEMESQLKGSIVNLISTQVMPLLTDSDIELSDDCSSDLLETLLAVQDLKLWAIRLLDASAKPIGGELYGRFGTYGSYEECLSVKFPAEEGEDPEKKSKGKYCLLDMRTPLPPKRGRMGLHGDIFQGMNVTFKYEVVEDLRRSSSMLYDFAIRYGVCIPSSCSEDDLLKIINSGLGDSGMTIDITSCETKEPQIIDTAQQIIIALFALIGIVNLISAALDQFLLKPIKGEITNQSTIRFLLETFNPIKNGMAVFETTASDGNIIAAIHGIRTFTMFWVFLSQTYISIDFMVLSNLSQMEVYLNSWSGVIIYNSAAAIDTFFLLTGILMAYNIVRDIDKRGFKNFNASLIIFRRILRLVPSLLLVVAITIMFPLINEGPIWKGITGEFANNCRQRWWAVPLFINNMFAFDEMCLPHSWYVSVDLQCLLIIMVYFILLYTKPVVAKMYLVFLIAGSAASCAVVTFYFDLLPTPLLGNSDKESFLKMAKYRYVQVYSRIGVYAIGVALGTLLARKNKFPISKLFIGALWAASAATALAVIFGMKSWNSGAEIRPIDAAVYAGVARLAWGLAVSWVVFICATGKGGLVNEFLSWSGYEPLSKVSYATYLMHVLVMFGYGATRHTTVGFTHIAFVWLFFGNLIACYMAGLGIRVFFEAPVERLSKTFIAWFSVPPKPILQEFNEATENGGAINNGFQETDSVADLEKPKEES